MRDGDECKSGAACFGDLTLGRNAEYEKICILANHEESKVENTFVYEYLPLRNSVPSNHRLHRHFVCRNWERILDLPEGEP